MKYLRIPLWIMLLFVFLVSGCNFDYHQLFTTEKKSEAPLIKAEIHFADAGTVTGYIRGLGVEDIGKVYVGGASLNYLYDQEGNIVGSYNYQRVDYIKILYD